MLLYEAARLARGQMAAHGLDDWAFRFDGAKRRFGICRFSVKVIGLSRHLTRLNDKARVQDVILHEIAHAVAGFEAHHGPKWRRVCQDIGARPERCYVSEEVNKPKPNWVGTCPECGDTYTRLRLSKRIRAGGCSNHGRVFDKRLVLVWKRIR